jgi:hypothetical protein
MTERVAIIGSRDYPDLEAVRAFVRSLPAGTTVISGGARGVDREAGLAALDAGLPFEPHLPDYNTYGRRAPLVRNGVIAERCDRMVAFWWQESRGTADAIRRARVLGKPVEVHHPHGGSDGD